MKEEEIIKSICKKYKKEIWSRFNKSIKEFNLIQENDKIMVCISGGKDSMLLAKCLEELKRHSYYHFDLEYVVMNPGYKEENLNLLKENLKKCLPFAIIFFFPMVWYLAIKQHSYTHVNFTYRLLVISIICVLVIATKIFKAEPESVEEISKEK